MTVYVKRTKRIDVYTDGACSGGTGPGGWAWAVASTPPGNGPEDSGGVYRTTNQRMELQAAWNAVGGVSGPVCIVTDSAYVMNCFEQKWYRGWKSGRKRNGDAVANWDIWEGLIEDVLSRDVTFRKVKGHSGDPMNDYVDRLAVRAKVLVR